MGTALLTVETFSDASEKYSATPFWESGLGFEFNFGFSFWEVKSERELRETKPSPTFSLSLLDQSLARPLEFARAESAQASSRRKHPWWSRPERGQTVREQVSLTQLPWVTTTPGSSHSNPAVAQDNKTIFCAKSLSGEEAFYLLEHNNSPPGWDPHNWLQTVSFFLLYASP